MTVKEARRIVREFDRSKKPSEDEIFMFTEAMDFLIKELNDPADMLYLGGYYYEQKRFDLALKYYEMSASFDYAPAYDCLGYIWYYGRTGQRDYEKARGCDESLLTSKGLPRAENSLQRLFRQSEHHEVAHR